MPSTRASMLAGSGEAVEERLREAVVLSVLALHPDLVETFDTALERMECTDPAHGQLRTALLRAAEAADPRGTLSAMAGAELETLRALPHVQIVPAVRNPEDAVMARLCLAEEFAKLEARRTARREIAEGVEEVGEGSTPSDEGLTWRLGQAAEAVNRAGRAQNEDSSDLGEDRAAMSGYLQSLIDGQVWVKKRH